MPVYEYLCKNGHRLEEFREMRFSSLPIQCTVCGAEAPRIPSAVRVFSDYQGYVSPASGKWVEGRRQREEDFKKTGTRPYEAGEKEEMLRRQQRNDQLLDRAIDDSVERAAAELHLR